MAIFDDVIAAAVAGRAVAAVPMVYFDFMSAPTRMWPGFGTVHAAGYDWTGAGDLGGIDGLSSAMTDAAQQVTFTLSGVTPEIQALAKDAQVRVRGRGVIVYVQFFSIDNMSPLGGMSAIWSGLMDIMTFVATGATSRTITLTAESDNADRRRPRFGLLTNADQQSRYSGDTALQYRSALRFKSLVTPW